jgi:hypothetical protein
MQIKIYLILDAEDKVEKGVADGYCELDGDALVPMIRIPSPLDLDKIPNTLTGKDADTLDGQHGAAFILHSLAAAASDFLVASGVGEFVKKTLAEVKTILGLGTAAYTAASDYVTHALATVENDFLVASGEGVFAKKTLAETKTILGLPQDIGEGHITILPWNYSEIIQGTWIFSLTASSIFYGIYYNSSNAQNDQLDFKIWLDAGTYDFVVIHQKTTSSAILTLLLDGESQGTIDFYGSTSYNNRSTINNIVVANSGLKTLSIKAATRNGSSGGWILAPSSMALFRTA